MAEAALASEMGMDSDLPLTGSGPRAPSRSDQLMEALQGQLTDIDDTTAMIRSRPLVLEEAA